MIKCVLTWHFVAFQPVTRSRSKVRVKGQGQRSSSRSKVEVEVKCLVVYLSVISPFSTGAWWSIMVVGLAKSNETGPKTFMITSPRSLCLLSVVVSTGWAFGMGLITLLIRHASSLVHGDNPKKIL